MNFKELEKLLKEKGYTFMSQLRYNHTNEIVVNQYGNTVDKTIYHVQTDGTKIYHVLKSVLKKTVEIYEL